jgi:Spy/CpxP family protein refolding chaperone
MACVALLVAGGVSSWAGSACCAAGGKAKAEKSYSSCTKALSGIDLTEEQKAKIEKIEAACKAEGCTVESCAKSMDEIRAVLTDEQRAQYDARLGKADKAKKGCG